MAEPRPPRVALRAMAALVVTAAGFLALGVFDPQGAYLWIKSLHVVAVISWMAGMLYLPRLFVNHVGLPIGSAESELLKGMERRLLRIIVNPAMIVSWIAGLWIAWYIHHFQGGWLHAKLALALAMSAVHGFFSRSVREFAEDRNTRSARFWRMANELPAVLMIGIVILAIVKPF